MIACRIRSVFLFALLALAGCISQPSVLSTSGTPGCPQSKPCPTCAGCPGLSLLPPVNALEPVGFDALPGWREDDLAQTWSAFLLSCQALWLQPAWQGVCATAAGLNNPDSAQARAFFEQQFRPYRVANPDGSTQGLITGYYEPLLHGSREKRAPYLYPIYAPPEDLLTIDLSAVNPDLKGVRLRGRIEGKRVVPYWSRTEIEHGAAPLAGKEIAWVDDPVELFFLQIQGSGRVQLDSGDTVRVGYADQNGHPFQSVGRYLIERGELKLEQASMQGIKTWAKANPSKLEEALDYNASYVFFRELPAGNGGPPGALGLPLTEGRSIAVDPRVIPLGTPVFLATTQPNSNIPLQRLMMAQDTGGAIRGAVRADFFWGFGAEAGSQAGRMRQQGQMWALLPKDTPPPKQ